MKALVLVDEFHIQSILKPGQGLVPVAGNGHGDRLVASGVDLDFMFERVVVEVVCRIDPSVKASG